MNVEMRKEGKKGNQRDIERNKERR